MGSVPPSVEMACFRSRPGKARTYTCVRPVSFDSYASHRPSGEMLAFRDVPVPWVTRVTVWALSNATAVMFIPNVPPCEVAKRPSRDQSLGQASPMPE